MRRLRDRNLWLAVIAGVLLLVLFRAPDEPDTEPLSRQSTQGDGTKALVLLLDRFGTKVADGSEPAPQGRALLLRDELSAEHTADIESWVRSGGTLIVADTNSSLSAEPYSGRLRSPRSVLTAGCDSPLVAGVREVVPKKAGVLDEPLSSFEQGQGDTACFLVDGGHYLASKNVGSGRIISVAGPDLFVNDRLDVADNSVLAVNLLASESGDLTVLTPRPLVTGEEGGTGSLGDLLPERTASVMVQLLIASLLFLLWRGRRLGRPLEEKLPVELPASALTAALGHLLQTAGRSDAASHILRARLRREIATLLGLRPTTDAAVLAQVAAERTGIDRQRLVYLLTDGPPVDNAELLRLAQQLELLHQEVANVR